jgi:hypothetical protein
MCENTSPLKFNASVFSGFRSIKSAMVSRISSLDSLSAPRSNIVLQDSMYSCIFFFEFSCDSFKASLVIAKKIMVVYVGIGGGSDVASCELIAKALNTHNFTLVTIMKPLEGANVVDMDNTILKYTGKPYMQQGRVQPARLEYSEFEFLGTSEGGRFLSTRRPYIVGLLVAQSPDSSVTRYAFGILTSLFESDPDREMIAVDTGGDSLRGIVPGMGDKDISNLFDGCIDTRDSDALRLLSTVVKGSVRLYVLGPGSDGETSPESLAFAAETISRSFNKPTCRFIQRGNMSEFTPYFHRVDAWNHPSPGSTIANILNALKCDPHENVTVYRRGNRVGTVPAHIMQQYLVIEVTVNSTIG